jgi:hypothetical protein
VPDEPGGPEKLALQFFDGFTEIGKKLVFGSSSTVIQ